MAVLYRCLTDQTLSIVWHGSMTHCCNTIQQHCGVNSGPVSVCFNSDNMAVVDLLCSRSTKDSLVMHLLRCLSFYAALYQFNFESHHVPGSQNTEADAISRNNISLFQQATQVDIPPSVIQDPKLGISRMDTLVQSYLAKVSRVL